MGRVAKRTRRRMACRIGIGGQRFSGVVLDLSSSGLFVQTTAKPRPREFVSVELSVVGQREPGRLEARVARVFVVPAQLLAVAQGGVGLRITNAPESFFALLRKIQVEVPAAGAALRSEPDGDVAGRTYRLRVTQLGRARTRTLQVIAESSEEAVALALAEVGEGWKVLECTEIEGS
jgi:hypothetical protein